MNGMLTLLINNFNNGNFCIDYGNARKSVTSLIRVKAENFIQNLFVWYLLCHIFQLIKFGKHFFVLHNLEVCMFVGKEGFKDIQGTSLCVRAWGVARIRFTAKCPSRDEKRLAWWWWNDVLKHYIRDIESPLRPLISAPSKGWPIMIRWKFDSWCRLVFNEAF